MDLCFYKFSMNLIAPKFYNNFEYRLEINILKDFWRYHSEISTLKVCIESFSIQISWKFLTKLSKYFKDYMCFERYYYAFKYKSKIYADFM